MQQLFIAKISLNNRETLIFCNEINFAPVSTFFPEVNSLDSLLNLSKEVLFSKEINLDLPLPERRDFVCLVESQFVLATGCTYQWSEQKINSTTDDNVYKRLYFSDRPMLFLKGFKETLALKNLINIRKDSTLTIPEAELVAVCNNRGEIIGHTIGNDVTAVDLEKENPLYQTQAKFYKGSFSLLPLIKLNVDLPKTGLRCQVKRKGHFIVDTEYSTADFIRDQDKLVAAAHELRISDYGNFLFLGCNASYPMSIPLTKDDEVIISSDLFPLKLINACEWLA